MQIRKFLAASAGGLFNVKDAEGNISSERICGITVATGLLVTGAVLIPFVLPFAIAAIGLGVVMFIGKGIIEAERQIANEQKLRDDLRALHVIRNELQSSTFFYNREREDGNKVELNGDFEGSGPSHPSDSDIAALGIGEVSRKCSDLDRQIRIILMKWDKFNDSVGKQDPIKMDWHHKDAVIDRASRFNFKELAKYLA